MITRYWKVSCSSLQTCMENLHGNLKKWYHWKGKPILNSAQILVWNWPVMTWKGGHTLLTLPDVSSLTPGYVLEELLKHPVCLFWVNKARNQMNPKDEKEKCKEYTLLYLLWENIFISRILKGVRNGWNASYQKSKPSILFLTTSKSRCERKNRKAPVES